MKVLEQKTCLYLERQIGRDSLFLKHLDVLVLLQANTMALVTPPYVARTTPTSHLKSIGLIIIVVTIMIS